MRFINPFDTSRGYFKASVTSFSIGISGWVLCALAAKGAIPEYFVWPGVAIFLIGWISMAFATIVHFVRVIRGHRS